MKSIESRVRQIAKIQTNLTEFARQEIFHLNDNERETT